MTALAKPVEIVEPGVYDLSAEDYHADPVPGGSLSSSGARKLLPPSCPAIYRWELDHPQPHKHAFDIGHAAHDAVLGKGPEIVPVDADDWRTNAAKAAAAEARSRNAVPVLAAEYQTVKDMAEALRAHPIAGSLLEPDRGEAEQSLFWIDEPSGIWRRARLDWLPHSNGQRLIVADYKSARSAEPGKFARAATDYGYHCQGAWYIDAVKALGIAEDVAFVFVVQEKTPPYLVSVIQLDAVAVRIGALLNRRAIDTYTHCNATDTWPGYVDDVALTSLPFWYERQYEGDLT